MKRYIVALSLLIVLFSSAYAQQTGNEKKKLTDQIAASYQKGDLEEAIKAGEKLIKLEKVGGDPVSYVDSLANLARFKREYYALLRNKMERNQIVNSEKMEASVKITLHGDDAERMFREALELSETSGRAQTAQTADIKKGLAWMVANHTYSGKKTLERSRGRIDEAAQLYADAIALSEQTRGKDADETLFIVLDAGDFYYKYTSFQKAISLYERFIQTYEQKHGAQHPDLVRALRPYASILYTIMLDQESAAAVKRIEAITKKPEPMPTGEIDLHLRSKESVAFSAPIIRQVNERSAAYRGRLEALGKSLNADNLASMPRLITVPVKVEVDETGKITKAAAVKEKDKLAAEAEAIVSKWTVSPISYNGAPRKMRGVLIYKKAR